MASVFTVSKIHCTKGFLNMAQGNYFEPTQGIFSLTFRVTFNTHRVKHFHV